MQCNVADSTEESGNEFCFKGIAPGQQTSSTFNRKIQCILASKARPILTQIV